MSCFGTLEVRLASNGAFGWGAVAVLLGLSAGVTGAAAAEICAECVSVKLEHPVVVRGPSRHEPDAPVSIIELPDGTFRAFAANATTVAIDGATPFALGARSKVVLEPGPAGSASECGRWLTSVLQGRGALYGLIHNEQRCDYRDGETYKSMSIARSEDLGLTWNVLGQIITADEGPASGRQGGEGDCTAVDGHDGYWYAYCQRLRDWKNTVARAPRNDPAPGKWSKWSGNRMERAGAGRCGGCAERSCRHEFGLLDRGGGPCCCSRRPLRRCSCPPPRTRCTLPPSRNRSFFMMPTTGSVRRRAISMPIQAWSPSMVSTISGSHFFLTYTYIPPGQDFTQRYLVMHEASIALAATPQRPQVRVALSRWTSCRRRQSG